MRTTLDLPDELLRLAKARAALRGISLKDFVAEALEKSLFYTQGSGVADGAEASEDVVVINENLVLPLIAGAGGPRLTSLTGGKAAELLEEEDVERAAGSRRR